ncbi:MAG TPA: hypothetical protein DE315_02235 [Candidatus Omnitrophica bacterium]|nr:MAG: hypothetical protein A2Y05_03195 [Omnitrophica WOR_2 bacterium GWA2_53_43]HBO96513.1 hypothetical protein [Candidatus Omnitrophota bacterium]HCI44338.1 hypothetical protein [Candidatus Omnitrophota bacterium]
MEQQSLFNSIGVVAAAVLPLFNIPLIIRIVKRGSSEDISLSWAVGVWVCILLMAPSGFTSQDVVWRTFNYTNLLLFTGVAFVTVKYRNGRNAKK